MRENLARRYSRYYVYLEPIVADPLVRGYFSLVASLLLVSFFLVFALSPTINTILALQKKIEEQKQVDTALQKKIADLVAAQDSFAQIQEILPAVFVGVPITPTPQTIISGVAVSASASGVKQTGISFHDLPLSSDLITSLELTPVEFTLSVTGDYASVRDFLGRVENASRLIKLKSIGVSQITTSTQVSININAQGYYLAGQEL